MASMNKKDLDFFFLSLFFRLSFLLPHLYPIPVLKVRIFVLRCIYG